MAQIPSTLGTAVAVIGPDGNNTWRCPNCWRLAPGPPADLYTRTVHVQAPAARPVPVQVQAARPAASRGRSDMSILVDQFQQAEVSSKSKPRSSSRSRGPAMSVYPLDYKRCGALYVDGDHKGTRCTQTSESVRICGYCGNHKKSFGFF